MNKIMRSFLTLPLLAGIILMAACQAVPKVESYGDYAKKVLEDFGSYSRRNHDRGLGIRFVADGVLCPGTAD